MADVHNITYIPRIRRRLSAIKLARVEHDDQLYNGHSDMEQQLAARIV